jgi:ATP-dependent Lon protease
VLQNIKEGITGHAVDWYSDVFDIIFPDLDAKEINEKWKGALKEEKSKKRKERKTKKKEEEEDDDESGDEDDD